MADSLADLVRAVWNGMELAGELGSLLKIELRLQHAIAEGQKEWEQRLPLFRVVEYGLGGETKEKYVGFVEGRDQDFWSKAEQLTLHALRKYAAKQSANGKAIARRLFAEDAEHGFALIDLCRKRFDVVLMNPPFGEATGTAQPLVERDIPEGANDIYAAFVTRMRELLSTAGMLGAITSRAFFVGRDLRLFRRFAHERGARLSRDLGGGVLDNAMVRDGSVRAQVDRGSTVHLRCEDE